MESLEEQLELLEEKLEREKPVITLSIVQKVKTCIKKQPSKLLLIFLKKLAN